MCKKIRKVYYKGFCRECDEIKDDLVGEKGIYCFNCLVKRNGMARAMSCVHRVENDLMKYNKRKNIQQLNSGEMVLCINPNPYMKKSD